MEVLVFGLLILVPTLGARLPRQSTNGELYTSHLSIQKSIQDESIFRDSGNPESVGFSIDDLVSDAPKSGSNLPSNTLAFEDGSLVEGDSNIPSAPALEERLELDSQILPSVIKSTEGEIVCGADEVLHVDGTCATPIIRRNIFAFAEPITSPTTTEPPIIPPPVVNYDIVFIKSPEPTNAEPIIIPPPQHKTLVYLLSKKSPAGPNLIEVPTEQSNPEVYFVTYNGATGRVDLGGPNSDIVLPTGDHLSNVLSTNFLQSDRSPKPTQNQDRISTSSDNVIRNHDSYSHYLQSVGSTVGTQYPFQGVLATSSDIVNNHIVLNNNLLQSAVPSAATLNPSQEDLFLPSDNSFSNQYLLNTNFVQQVGPTAGVQNPTQGALSTFVDIRSAAPQTPSQAASSTFSDHSFSNQDSLNTNIVQQVGPTAAPRNPSQAASSPFSDHSISNQHLLNTNFVQQVGPTAAVKNPSQGASSTFVDIKIDNQNDNIPIHNSLPAFQLIDSTSVNNLDLPQFEIIQNLGTASNDEILRRFVLNMSNVNLLRRSLKL